MDKLFEAILNKSYLPQSEQPSTVAKTEKDEQKKEEVMFLPDFQIIWWLTSRCFLIISENMELLLWLVVGKIAIYL